MQLPSEQQVASFHQGNRDTYQMTAGVQASPSRNSDLPISSFYIDVI